MRRIDEARDNVVMTIDGRPALEVFLEDIGPELAQDLRRLGGMIFAGLPVAGSDTGDYLVRNLMAIDPRQGWIVLGAEVAPGDQIVFCRRDPESASKDLGAHAARSSAAGCRGRRKAGIYVSCIARGVVAVRRAGGRDRADPRDARRLPARSGFSPTARFRATGSTAIPGS